MALWVLFQSNCCLSTRIQIPDNINTLFLEVCICVCHRCMIEDDVPFWLIICCNPTTRIPQFLPLLFQVPVLLIYVILKYLWTVIKHLGFSSFLDKSGKAVKCFTAIVNIQHAELLSIWNWKIKGSNILSSYFCDACLPKQTAVSFTSILTDTRVCAAFFETPF